MRASSPHVVFFARFLFFVCMRSSLIILVTFGNAVAFWNTHGYGHVLPGNKRVELSHERHTRIIDPGCVSQGNTGIHVETSLFAAVGTVLS